jgi:hypothetical protein
MKRRKNMSELKALKAKAKAKAKELDIKPPNQLIECGKSLKTQALNL